MRIRFLVLAVALTAAACAGDDAADTELAAHFPFDGDAVDVVGGAAGIVTGATPTTDRFSQPDGALDFDGDGDVVEFAHRDALDLGMDFTLAVWVDWRTQASPDEWYTLFEKSDPERDGHSRYGIWVRDDRLWGCFEAADNLSQPCADTDEPIPTDGWHHVAAVRDQRRLILYLDGVEVWNAFVGLTPISQTPFDAFAGGDLYARESVWLDAALDDLRIYDIGLDPAEIADLAADR